MYYFVLLGHKYENRSHSTQQRGYDTLGLKRIINREHIKHYWDVIQWASYQIRKIAGCACAGNVFPRRRFQRKPLVNDPGMHHGTYVTHVPWCMSGLLTCGDGENVPGIPGACAPPILCIWQEAHDERRPMFIHFRLSSYRWISARLQYLQCVSYRYTAVLH